MRLIHRQSEILNYLLSPNTFRGKADLHEIPAALAGLDSQRLRVLGLFSLGKRQEKISSILPKTWSYLRENELYNFMDFASRYPQHDPAHFANGEQYFSYLQEIWQLNMPEPLWLPDIAQYEIEYAAARSGGIQLEKSNLNAQSCQGCIRRHRYIRLSRYKYDIRQILVDSDRSQIPAMRDIRLAFLAEHGAQEVRVFELTPPIFDILDKLDSWSPIEQFKIDGINDTKKLVKQLESLALIEVCI